MRRSECEMISTGPFFFIFAQGDRKGPALVYRLTHTCLCFPECHCHHSVQSAIALCKHLVAMTTHSDKCANGVSISAS